MSDPALIKRLGQGLVCLVLAMYKRRLRAIVGAAPAWVGEEILGASSGIGNDGVVLWISKTKRPHPDLPGSAADVGALTG